LHVYHGTIVLDHFIAHVGHRGDDLNMMLAFEPLLDDFHMQQPQVAAAKTKAKRRGSFRLKRKCRVVEAETFERMAQTVVILRIYRIEPAKHHGFEGTIARQGRDLLYTLRLDHRIANAGVGEHAYPGDEIPDFPSA